MKEIKNTNIWRFDREITDWLHSSNKLLKKFSENAYKKCEKDNTTSFIMKQDRATNLIASLFNILTQYDNMINDRPIFAQEPADYIVILDEENKE